MKLIRTEDAVGSVLCHDITQIIPGVVKDAVFRKGHVVTEEDVPVLLSVGKEHLYVWEKQEGMLHENDAAEVLRQVCQGEYMNASEAKEGKIELTAQCDGLLKINREKLNEVNALGQIVLASRHGNFPVKKGDKIVGMRVVPLVIEEEKMNHVKELCGEEPIFTILPFHQMKVGIVTTGSEVYHGRITDKFTPVVKAKLEEQKQNEIKRAYQDEAIDKIVDKSTMELPDAMIDTQCENMINQFAQQMAQQGLSMDQYLQFSGLTLDQLKEQVRPDAITRIKSSLVLEQIAKEENIEITDADVDAEIEKMATMYNMEADKLKEYMGEDEKENMKQDLAVQKAVELITESVKPRAKAKTKKEKEAEAETEAAE